jgi:hypothetical protein
MTKHKMSINSAAINNTDSIPNIHRQNPQSHPLFKQQKHYRKQNSGRTGRRNRVRRALEVLGDTGNRGDGSQNWRGRHRVDAMSNSKSVAALKNS